MILNIYSHYTKPQGSIKFTDLVAEAREKGMRALALTDHGNFSGIVEFYHLCLLNGIKPIIGLDFFYQLSNGTFVRLIIYLRNYEGYTQILKLVSHLDKGIEGCSVLRKGTEFKADNLLCLINLYKMDYYSEQLPFCSDPAMILREVSALGDFHSIFFQLMKDEHKDNRQTADLLINSSLSDNNIRLAAVSPVYYLNPQDCRIKKFLLSHYKGHESTRIYANQCPERILISQNEFPPEAHKNRLYIADQCNLLLDEVPVFFPEIRWHLPDIDTALELLQEKIQDNLQFYYASSPDLPRFLERIEFELKIIKEQKLASYFYFLHLFREKFVEQYQARIYFGGKAVYFFCAYLLRLTVASPVSFKTNYSKTVFNDPEFYPVIVVNLGSGQKANLRKLLNEIFGREKICSLVDFVQWNAASLISALGKYQGHSKETVDNVLKNIPVRYRFEPLKNLLRLDSLKSLISENYASKELLRFAWLLDETSRTVMSDTHSLVIGHHNVQEMLPVHLESDHDGTDTKTFFDLETAKFFGVWTLQVNSYKALDILDQVQPQDRFMTEDDIGDLSEKLEKAILNQKLNFLPFISWREDKTRILGLFSNHHLYNIALYLESYLFSFEQLELKLECDCAKSLVQDLKYTGGKIVFYEQVVYIIEKLFKGSEYTKVKKLIYKSKNIHYLKKMLNNLIKNRQDQQHVNWLKNAVLPSAFLTTISDTAFKIFIIMKMLAAREVNYTEFIMYSFIDALNNDTADYDKFLPEVQKSGISVLPLSIENTVFRATYDRERKELRLPLYVIRGIAPHVSNYLHDFCQANKNIRSVYRFMEIIDKEQIKPSICDLLCKTGFFDQINSNRKAVEEIIHSYYEMESRKIEGQNELFDLETFIPGNIEISDYSTTEKRELEEKLTGFSFTSYLRQNIADFTRFLLIPDCLKIAYYVKRISSTGMVRFTTLAGAAVDLEIADNRMLDDYHPYFIFLGRDGQTVKSYRVVKDPWQELNCRLFFSARSTQTELLDKLLSFTDSSGRFSFIGYLTDLNVEIASELKISLNPERIRELEFLLQDNPFYIEISGADLNQAQG